MPEAAASASGQIALRALGPRSLRLLGALVVYGALLYVGFGLGAALPLERALLRTAAWTMDRVSGGTIERTVNLAPRGRKALYVASHASHIVEWPEEDGRALLDELLAFATQPQFIYAHQWQVGDVVIWDNLATMHRARPFDDRNQIRDVRRTTCREADPAEAS